MLRKGAAAISVFSLNKRFNYHVGRGYYISIIYEIRDVSDFDKGNADTLILYVHP